MQQKSSQQRLNKVAANPMNQNDYARLQSANSNQKSNSVYSQPQAYPMSHPVHQDISYGSVIGSSGMPGDLPSYRSRGGPSLISSQSRRDLASQESQAHLNPDGPLISSRKNVQSEDGLAARYA